MAGDAVSLSLSAVLALWSALACAEQSAAAPHVALASPVSSPGNASRLRTAEPSLAAERDATILEILRGYKARKAALVLANIEHLNAIDLGGGPCSWKAIIARTVPIPFRVRPGLPPFVRFVSGVLAIKFVQGTPTAANVMSDGGGIVLHAVADVHDLSFYPARPLTLSGFVRLHASAYLSVSRVEDAQVDLSYQVSDTVGLRVEPARVSAKVPCPAVTLVKRGEAFEQRPDPRSSYGALLKTSSLPLATTPGGRVVARLTIEDGAAVEVMERRAGHVLIELSRDDDTIFGWVPSSALDPHPPGYLGHGSGQIADHTSSSIDETARCSLDVPLAVQQGSERRTVGVIRAETTFKLVARARGAVSVEFYKDAGLLLEPRATFVIDPSVLAACRVRTPPRFPSERHR